VMADVLNLETESKPLNTELETPELEPVTEQSVPSPESTLNPEVASAPEPEAPHEAEVAAAVADIEQATVASEVTESPVAETKPEAASEAGHDAESAADFASLLEAYEREQAAEAAAVEAYGDSIVSGRIANLTDKHAVIDVGLKSDGLLPIEQILDHNGQPRFQAGDVIDVVIEREEPEGGYLVSYDKARVGRDRESRERKDRCDGNGGGSREGRSDGRYRAEGIFTGFSA
jgi:small subunit ribosomal protein S1